MAGRLINDLRMPSFGSPKLDPAHELAAQSEFVDSSLYESLKQQPRRLSNVNPSEGQPPVSSLAKISASPLGSSILDEDLVGVAHKLKKANATRSYEPQGLADSSDSNQAESDADISTRQRLVSQKLLGKKTSKGAPARPQDSGQLSEVSAQRMLSQVQAPPTTSSFPANAWEQKPHRGDHMSLIQPEVTSAPIPAPLGSSQPGQSESTPSFASHHPYSHPSHSHQTPSAMQNLLLAQMQQQQQQVHPMYWPYLNAHQYRPPWPSHTAPSKAIHTAPPAKQQLEAELSSATAKWETTRGGTEEGAPLEALSELMAKDRANQELVSELRGALEEERLARQRAEEQRRGLEAAVVGIGSRMKDLEDEVSEATERSRRLEEEARQAKQRLRETEKELEAARRKMQEDAEKVVRLERKDSRLADELADLQTRDQQELEALSEEKRRLEGDIAELRKLPVVAELLREDNESLRARLQRAEKDRGNLQELVAGFRQSVAELEQAEKRAVAENGALRKECNMLKLQLATKDTAISQLQVALFTGREERTDLGYKLRKLEDAAASAMDAAATPSRRASFGARSVDAGDAYWALSKTNQGDPCGDSSTTPRVEIDRADIAETQGGSHVDDWSGSRAQAMRPESGQRLPEPAKARDSRRAFEPIPANPPTDRSAGLRPGVPKPSPEQLPPAGVFSPVGRNRAQQLAGDDMRRSLTMDRAADRGDQNGFRSNERNPSAKARVGSANERLASSNDTAMSSNDRVTTGNGRGGVAQEPVPSNHWRGSERPSPAEEKTPPEEERNSAQTDRNQHERNALEPSSISNRTFDARSAQSSYNTNSPPDATSASRPSTSASTTNETLPRGAYTRPASPGVSSGVGQPERECVQTPARAREAVPFATEQSLQETIEETAAIESKLMEVSLERSQLESEYAKLPQSAGRTMTERRRKQDLEARIEDLTKKIGWLRMELRERHVLHK